MMRGAILPRQDARTGSPKLPVTDCGEPAPPPGGFRTFRGGFSL